MLNLIKHFLIAQVAPSRTAPPNRELLDVLGEPANAVTVSLAHDYRAHKHLDRADALQRHLALASRLVQAELVAESVLGDRAGVIDLVSEDDKGNFGELLHGEQGVELGLGLGESLLVLCVDKEHDTVDLGEVVSPDTAGYSFRGELPSAILLCNNYGQARGGRRSRKSMRDCQVLPWGWPPRSNVVKRTLPMASSSEAAHHVSSLFPSSTADVHGNSLGWRVGCRTATRSF